MNKVDEGWVFAQIGQGIVNYDRILKELVIPIPVQKKLTLTTKPALVNRMMVVCMYGDLNLLGCG
jgi:hypothetical protein